MNESQMRSGPEWSANLARMIAGEVRRRREARKMSAQQLSDACAALGYPIHRSVLANFENGRRPTISVAELLVIARALDTAPVLLLFPVGYADQVEMLPGDFQETLSAVSWAAGDKPRERGFAFVSRATEYQLAAREREYAQEFERRTKLGDHRPQRIAELRRDFESRQKDLERKYAALEELERRVRQLSDPNTRTTSVDLAEAEQRLQEEKEQFDLEREEYERTIKTLSTAESWSGVNREHNGRRHRYAKQLLEMRAEMRARGMLTTELSDDAAALLAEEPSQ